MKYSGDIMRDREQRVHFEEAVSIFRANGLSGAAKEVGTDKWIEY